MLRYSSVEVMYNRISGPLFSLPLSFIFPPNSTLSIAGGRYQSSAYIKTQGDPHRGIVRLGANSALRILTEVSFQAQKQDWRVVVAFVAVLSCIVIEITTYLVISIQAALTLNSSKHRRRPPILPYWFPLLGSVVSYFTNGPRLAAELIHRFGQNVPAGLQLGPMKLYLVGNPDHANIFYKPTPGLASNLGVTLAMQKILGTPAHILPLYSEDDSGQLAVPVPGSTTPKEHRIRFFHSRAAHHFLTGKAGIRIGERYMDILSRNLTADAGIDNEWIDVVDLSVFIQNLVFPAATEAICGTAILTLNPSLTEDFWIFERSIPTLLKQVPRWLSPNAYRSREKMLSNIKRWHAYGNERTDVNKLDSNDPEWDEFLGSKFIRERQRFLQDIDIMDADGRASEDLGLLFASAANSVTAVFWTMFEVFKRPQILSRVRDIAQSAYDLRSQESESVRLGEDPLLQSIFAEVTRLRVVGIVPRYTVGGDFQLGEWSIPEGSFLGLPSQAGCMNKNVWNAGTDENPHPLEEFWAERFLIYPNDPNSGPLRRDIKPSSAVPLFKAEEETSNEPKFSLKGLKEVYTPFGGGSAICPGRHFARQEVVSTLARLVLWYDIELQVPDTWEPRMDPAFFPTGTLPPLDKVPFRIRRRKV